MRSFKINIYNQLIRGEWKHFFFLSKIFMLGTDGCLKDALTWTDLGWPGAAAVVCGRSDELLPCLTFGSGSEPSASPVFQGELLNLAKQCNLPVRKVEKWFRRRRNMDRPSLSKKFSEAWWAGAQVMNVRFSPELSSTDSSLPAPALRSYTEIPAPCLPSISVQRTSWVFPDPLGSAVTLCCFSVTETFLAFSPYFQSQVSFYCCTFIPYWALVSDFFWLCQTGILLWHTFVPEKLLFTSYCFAAALVPTKKAPFLLPFQWFPFVSLQGESFCCTFSATVLHTVAFKSHRRQAGLDSAVIWLQGPKSQKPAPFHWGGKLAKTALNTAVWKYFLLCGGTKWISDQTDLNASPGSAFHRKGGFSTVWLECLIYKRLLCYFCKELDSPRKTTKAKEIIKYLEYYSSLWKCVSIGTPIPWHQFWTHEHVCHLALHL